MHANLGYTGSTRLTVCNPFAERGWAWLTDDVSGRVNLRVYMSLGLELGLGLSIGIAVGFCSYYMPLFRLARFRTI